MCLKKKHKKKKQKTKKPMRLKVLILLPVLILAVLQSFSVSFSDVQIGVLAATSINYEMESSVKHAASQASNNYSLCSQIPFSASNGSSASYQLMPSLNCSDQAPVVVAPFCGDGIKDPGEVCDGTDFGGLSCSDFGYTSGVLGCLPDCTALSVAACFPKTNSTGGGTGPGGGSGTSTTTTGTGTGTGTGSGTGTGTGTGTGGLVTTGTGGTGSTTSTGIGTGTAGTATTGSVPISPPLPLPPQVQQCGNGSLDDGEQCDDGNALNGDGCSSSCDFEPEEPALDIEASLLQPPVRPAAPEPAQILSYCGNGFVELSESCDDSNRESGDGCSAFCQIETLLPPSIPAGSVTVPGEPSESLDLPELGLIGEYLTNDITTLFFEEFPEGSGSYDITLRDAEKRFDIEVLETSPGYFSFLLEEDLPDGFYTISVVDLLQEGVSRDLILEVQDREIIDSPLLTEFDDRAFESFGDQDVLYVYDDQPLLRGVTPLGSRVALYSELLNKTFIVATNDSHEFEFLYPEVLVAGVRDTLSIVAHYENGYVSEEVQIVLEKLPLRGVAPQVLMNNQGGLDLLFWAFVTTVSVLTTSLLLMLFRVIVAHQRVLVGLGTALSSPSRMLRSLKVVLSFLLAMAFFVLLLLQASAFTTTTPNVIPYEGILKDSTSTPITTPVSLRFSVWLDGDFTVGVDRDGAGAIPGAAPGFSGYSEVHIVTPDTNGFFQVDIGSIGGTIPEFNIVSDLFLQVEVKPSASPDTAYETLDIDGVDNVADRQTIGTMPYARNADYIDNREIGTSSGDIAILGVGDVFPISVIPGGTNSDDFIIDADDDAPGLTQLSFGPTLSNRILQYDPNGVAVADGWFNFTDDVNIDGDLTVTGTINGVTLGPQSKSIQLQPEYPNTIFERDGADNRGKLEVFFVDTDGGGGPNNFNYYEWTTRQSGLQDLDVIVRFHIPEDFTAFQATPMVLRYRTLDNNVLNNRIDVEVQDSTGTTVAGLTGGSALVNSTFTTSNITFGGGGTFTAGSEVTIILKMSALSSGAAHLSDLTINYIGN